ncbi:MAG: diacylglycerol kinase family protein [Dehalococcoidia bacterium]
MRVKDASPIETPAETVIILNPAARNMPNRESLSEADRWLQEHGWHTQWLETTRPREATAMAARAAEQGVPLIFVCGGDGTVSEAANGLAGSETALATIRGGTSNIWAREAGIPRRPVEAVRACVQGERRQVDLGRAGDRYFLLMAGFGLDGLITRNVSLSLKRRLGTTAYALTAVREAWRYRGAPLSLRLDGETHKANVLLLVAGNTRNYAGVTEVTPEARIDDGLLDVCIYEGRGRADIVMHTLRTLLRRHRRSSRVRYARVRRLELAYEEPLPLQLDGEAIVDSPTEVTVAPAALWVTVPRGLKSPLYLG